MTPPALNRIRVSLYGSDSAGTPIGVGIAADLASIPVRTIGLYGDPLDVIVRRSHWPDGGPEGWDLTKDFRITFGLVTEPGASDVQVVTLGGYRLMFEDPAAWGVAQSEEAITDADAEVAEQTVRLVLWTWPRVQREIKGAVLKHKTLNPLKTDGLVDTGHADYKTNSELAALALDTLACTCTSLPAWLDTFGPPGKLDWGNAPAIDELDDLLSRLGGAAALNNAGSDLSIVKLPRGGETLTLDSIVTEHALPYRLGSTPALRRDRIVITSGRTRTTIVRRLVGSDLEWVWFDPAAGVWKNRAETSSGILPDDIAQYRLPPARGDLARAQEYQRLFRAVRPVNAANREAMKRMVVLPQGFTFGTGEVLSGAACAVYAYASLADGNIRHNVPAALVPARIAGIRAYPLHGVVEMPRDVEFVRVPTSGQGVAQAVEIESDEFALVFAHESTTGVFRDDYFVIGYKTTESAGVLTTVEMTSEELDAAIADPEVPKVALDFLRLVRSQDGAADPVDVNRTELKAVALDVAKVRTSAGTAKSGTITLSGIRDVAPGACGGAVSRVVWDIDGLRTTLHINAHEAPTAWLDQIEASAGRSMVSGLQRALDPRSSSGLSSPTGFPKIGGHG